MLYCKQRVLYCKIKSEKDRCFAVDNALFCNTFAFREYRFSRYHYTDARDGVGTNFLGYMKSGRARLVSAREEIEVGEGELFYTDGLPVRVLLVRRAGDPLRLAGLSAFSAGRADEVSASAHRAACGRGGGAAGVAFGRRAHRLRQRVQAVRAAREPSAPHDSRGRNARGRAGAPRPFLHARTCPRSRRPAASASPPSTPPSARSGA